MDIAKVLEHYGAEWVPEGRNRALRCPFHDDRSASASVDTDRGLFNCHGCGVAGDAIKLIQIREGMGFIDAKRRAEEITGERHQGISETTDESSRSSRLPQWARDRFGGGGPVQPGIRRKP